jgi:hypothetical protein
MYVFRVDGYQAVKGAGATIRLPLSVGIRPGAAETLGVVSGSPEQDVTAMNYIDVMVQRKQKT